VITQAEVGPGIVEEVVEVEVDDVVKLVELVDEVEVEDVVDDVVVDVDVVVVELRS
jgi:hypothetical protein